MRWLQTRDGNGLVQTKAHGIGMRNLRMVADERTLRHWAIFTNNLDQRSSNVTIRTGLRFCIWRHKEKNKEQE